MSHAPGRWVASAGRYLGPSHPAPPHPLSRVDAAASARLGSRASLGRDDALQFADLVADARGGRFDLVEPAPHTGFRGLGSRRIATCAFDVVALGRSSRERSWGAFLMTRQSGSSPFRSRDRTRVRPGVLRAFTGSAED